MSFDVTIAGTAIPTNVGALKSFQNVLNLAFSLDSTLVSLLDSALSNVPSNSSKSTIAYTSPAASWNPGGGPVQFGLQGGATGTLEVVTSGDLVSYTDGLDSPEQKSISATANIAYMKLTLKFTISANVSANYSGGTYGVKSSLDSSDTYAISFCKAFTPSTLVRTAIAETFESFVLPLHKDTLAQLSDGDHLLYEFDGNLHLSFGAYTGLDQVLYAGQSSLDVLQTFGSPLATLSASTKPEITLGATLDFSFQYATRFETLLSKFGGTARVHLFRSTSAATATTLKAGLTFDANTSASITSHVETVQGSLVKAAGGTGTAGGTAIGQVLSSTNAVTEINKYVAEVNDKLSSWLNRANGLQANLQVAIETSNTRTVLAGYDFDLTSPKYPAAWQAAIAGDLVGALQTGAVTLDIGSGLEHSYQSKTSFTCNFFNLWSLSTWSQFTSNVSLVYAGNNVFHFVAKIDRTLETDSMGAMHSMDVYFSASADVASGGKLSNTEIELHINMTAQSDPKAASKIATMLSAIEGGPACDALSRGMHSCASNSKKGTAQLQVTIPSSAYARINCDAYDGDKPLTNRSYNDSANWTAFAQAADDLNAWPLRQMSTVSTQNLTFLKSFVAWEDLNEAANGSKTPNRMHPGNAYNNWPENFPQVDDTSRSLIVHSMLAGQSFMNFCAALRNLMTAVDTKSAGSTWDALLQLVTNAIKEDLNVDFLRPAALAVIRLCVSPTIAVSGPTGPAIPANSFAVSLRL